MRFWENSKMGEKPYKPFIYAVSEECQKMENPQKREVKLIFGEILMFLGIFLGSLLRFWENSLLAKLERILIMRKKNYKGRCTKKTVSKSKEVCRIYDEIAFKYIDVLEGNKIIGLVQHHEKLLTNLRLFLKKCCFLLHLVDCCSIISIN